MYRDLGVRRLHGVGGEVMSSWMENPRHAESVERIRSKIEKRMGEKHDAQKPRWSLLPGGTLAKVIAVLEYGAVKYQVDNWQHVPEPDRRYYDAAMRHIQAWLYGEQNDPESGQPHLAHAVASLLFLMWFDSRKEKGDAG